MIITIIWARTQGAILAGPFSLATARTIKANTVPRTVSRAGSQATVYISVSRIAQALSVDAGAVPRAIILASL